MTLEHAAVDQQRSGESRVIKIADQVAEEISGQRSRRRRFEWMNAYDHVQRLGRIPEDLEVRSVELTFADLRRNLNSAKPKLRSAFELFRGGRRILHRDTCQRHEVGGVARSQSRHGVVVGLRNLECESG